MNFVTQIVAEEQEVDGVIWWVAFFHVGEETVRNPDALEIGRIRHGLIANEGDIYDWIQTLKRNVHRIIKEATGVKMDPVETIKKVFIS